MLVRKSIEDASKIEHCPDCGMQQARIYHSPYIHMNEAVGNINGEDYHRTNEPPDELKSNVGGGWNTPAMTSYPNSKNHRKLSTQN